MGLRILAFACAFGVLSLLGASAAPLAELPQDLAVRLHRTLHGLAERAVARAGRSDRLTLKIGASFLDARGRMLLDLQGTVRTRVPLAGLRRTVAAKAAARESWILTSNGPVAIDFVLTPMKLEGEEATFTFQLDLTILFRPLLAELARNGAYLAGSVALGTVAKQAIEALQGLDADALGDGLALGVGELSGMLSGEAAAKTFQTVTDSARRGWIARLRAPLGVVGLLRHFLTAVLLSGSNAGAATLGTSLGAALGATLLPAGGSFVVAVVSTAAVAWFGTWAVTTLTVNLPVAWKFGKLEKLHAAGDAAGWKAHADRLAGTLEAEIDGSEQRWPVLELLIARVAKVRAGPGAAGLEAYRPVVDMAKKRLQFQAVAEGNFYAARIYYQLLGALGENPHGGAE